MDNSHQRDISRDKFSGVLSAENANKLVASNPVAPTIDLFGLQKKLPTEPVAQPVTSASDEVWSALAEIGRQLQNLAATQTGQGFRRPQNSPALYAADSPSLVELVNQFLLAKARANRSDRYLRALRNSLGKFIQVRANQFIHEITVQDVEKFMHNAEWSPRTQRGYVADVRTLFNFAVRRGLLKSNPAAGVELPTEEPEAIEIYSPAETKTILEFARRYDLNICRALACRFFAGLRSIEAERMDEKYIGAKYIEVTAATAKGARARRRRLVTIQPNLRAWLNLGGKLPVTGNKSNVWRDFTAAMTKETGVPWRHNATRHSFCSYHLAMHQNAGKTALESGHSEAMLFGNYRELVTPEEADEFYGIYPKPTL
jgi:integrase